MAPRGTVTNYLQQSNGLVLSPWGFTNLPANTPNQADPLGGTRATAFTETVDAGTSHITYGTALSAALNQRIIVSVYFKAGARSCLAIAPGAATCYVNFDSAALTAGTISGPVLGYGIEQVQGAPGWVRAWVVCNVAFAEMRYYVTSTSAGLNYTGTGAVAATFFGAMVEIAVPGQTTPSPYVASGATSGVGRRDTRQNLVIGSETSLGLVPFTGITFADNSTDVPPPAPGMAVVKVTYDGSGTANNFRLAAATGNAIMRVTGYVGCVWMRTLTGTRNVETSINGIGSTLATLTTTWQRVPVYMTGNGSSFLYLHVKDGVGVNSAGSFYVSGFQIAQAGTGTVPDYVKTTSAPFNPNGAPRSLVL